MRPGSIDRRAFLQQAVVALTTAAPGGMLSGQAMAAARQLRAGDIRDVDYPTVQALSFIDRTMRRATGSSTRVRIFANAQLGDEREVLEQLRLGIVDMARVHVAPLSNLLPELGALMTPFIFKSDTHLQNVIDGSLGRDMLEALRPAGFVGLTFLDAGPRYIYNRIRPVHTAADLAGLRLNCEQSSLSWDILTALSALPMQLPVSHILPALNAGLADGALDNIASYVSLGHHAAAKHITFIDLDRSPDVILISLKAWDNLDDADRKTLFSAAQEARYFMRPIFDRWVRLSTGQGEEQGVNIVRQPNEGSFHSAFAPLIGKLESGPARRWIRDIRALQ